MVTLYPSVQQQSEAFKIFLLTNSTPQSIPPNNIKLAAKVDFLISKSWQNSLEMCQKHYLVSNLKSRKQL